MLPSKYEILAQLELAFEIPLTDIEKRRLSAEDRMLRIMLRQAEVINKLIEKNNKLAEQVVGRQPPKRDKNGIIVLPG